MLKIALIALGGGIGSVARYLLAGAAQRFGAATLPFTFPLGTFTVNILGCLAIGALAAWFNIAQIREEYRFALTAGFLGGFTTFSAFGLETFQLAADGQSRLAFANVVLSCALRLCAVWIGFRLTERLLAA